MFSAFGPNLNNSYSLPKTKVLWEPQGHFPDIVAACVLFFLQILPRVKPQATGTDHNPMSYHFNFPQSIIHSYN
jgi:hypothetical protein